jgi:hypothetical protein
LRFSQLSLLPKLQFSQLSPAQSRFSQLSEAPKLRFPQPSLGQKLRFLQLSPDLKFDLRNIGLRLSSRWLQGVFPGLAEINGAS